MDESLDRREHAKKMFDQRWDQLKYLPPQILLDLARNEGAPREWRKAAVQLLVDHNFRESHHPDLAIFLLEIEAEQTAKHDVEAVVESANEGPIISHVSAPSASVTTASLQQSETINNIPRNPQSLNDDALGETVPAEPKKNRFLDRFATK